MNIIEIKVPALGESVNEATVGKWHKQPGEDVTADTILVELETDKVTLEVYAPSDGKINEVLVKTGSTVKVGSVLASFAPDKVEIKKVEKAEEAKQETKSVPAVTPASPTPSAKPHGAADVNEFINSAHKVAMNCVPR
jgi:2-oxoglutarate dehydrogenase E2 component (dihydrolipoamide succinyltransferase)